MARVLVTGATGFVGPSVVNLGLRLGHEVIATDLKPLYKEYLDPKADLRLGVDLTDPAAIGNLLQEIQPEIILHVAAYFRFYGPWERFYRVNVEGTRNLMEGALKIPAPKAVVVWSSGSVLGYQFNREEALDEGVEPKPRSNYEKSKLLEEQKGLEYKDRLPVTVIRPAAIYGSGVDFGGPAGTYAALKVVQMLFKNQLPGVPGWGHNKISFIHVEDIARTAYFLAGLPQARGEVYNVTDASLHSLKDLILFIVGWLRRNDIPVDFSSRFHFPLPVIYLLGLWCETLAKIQKREPAVERDFLNFFRKGYHFLMSNAKLDRLIRETEGKRPPLLAPIIRYRDIIHDGGFEKNLEWYKGRLVIPPS